MSKNLKNQTGGSAIGNLLTLAVAVYAFFLGFQYVPQRMEASMVDGILDSIQGSFRFNKARDAGAVQSMIDTQLNLNGAVDLRDSFKVAQNGNSYLITVSYDRELNLLYEKKTLHYEKTLTLD